jgi:predicted dehydrogenase
VSRPLRVAVVGAGHLGRIHARLARQLPEWELVAVVDTVPAARNAVAGENQAQGLAHHSELAGRVDAAIVATPTRLHHAIGMDLLRAGVHLFVEKPITSRLSEADELVAAARRLGRVLQVGHVERFNPVSEAIWPRVQRPRYIEAVRAGPYSFRSTDVGVVLDLMIHDIDLALALAGGMPVRVDALGGKVLGPHEDLAQARLEWADGCVANLSASRVSFATQRTMQVFGAEGYAAIDFSTRVARLIRPSERVLRGQIDVEGLDAAEKERLKTVFFEEVLPTEVLQAPPGNAILQELRDFAAAIIGGRAPRVPGEAGRDALAVAELVLASLTSRRGQSDSPSTPRHPPIAAPHFVGEEHALGHARRAP